MDIFILIYILFYAVLTKLRLDWAIIFLLATLPTYLIRFTVLDIPFTLLEAMILISFAVWFIWHTEFLNFLKGKYGWKNFKENRKKRIRYPFDVEIILLLIVSFIAVAIAGFNDSSLGIWKAYFFEPILLFIIILNVFGYNTNDVNEIRMTRMEKILWPLAISALAISALAIYQKFTGVWIFNDFWAAEETRRVTSFFGYPNAVTLYLGPLMLLFIGWLFYQIKNYKKQVMSYGAGVMGIIFTSLTILTSILAIYFAKSKGALLGVAIGLLVFAWLASKKIRWAILIIIIIAIAGFFIQPIKSSIYERIYYSKSLQIRQAQWQETWKMLKDNRFISGSGLANYQKAITPYHQEGIFYNDGTDPEFHRHTVWDAEYRAKVWQPLEIYLYPHNIFLNFWTELGLAGLLLFIWIIGKFLYLGTKLIPNPEYSGFGIPNKYLLIGLICSMVVIVIHGLVDVPYFKNDLAMMFWIFIAMMVLIKLERWPPSHTTG